MRDIIKETIAGCEFETHIDRETGSSLSYLLKCNCGKCEKQGTWALNSDGSWEHSSEVSQ